VAQVVKCLPNTYLARNPEFKLQYSQKKKNRKKAKRISLRKKYISQKPPAIFFSSPSGQNGVTFYPITIGSEFASSVQ
jgi:hypothetical protein